MKNAGAGAVTANPVGKIFLCFETKPLVFTLLLLAISLLTYFSNPTTPLYRTLLSATCRCSTTTTTTASAAINATTLRPFLSLSSRPSTTTNLPNLSNIRKINTPPNPNKRSFQAYGNAAALFVQMGAYRGGPSTFAIVGLASKPIHVYGHPWFKCEWVSNRNGSTPVRSKAYRILPDWGYGRVYTVVVVNCTFPSNPNSDNSGGKLILYAYYSLSPRRFEKFTSLEESPGSYDENKFNPPYPYEYLYCGSSLYGNLNAKRIKEWIAYHAWFFGPRSHFVFHDAGGVSDEVRAVLEPWVRAGRATVQDIRDQEKYDGYYYNQFLVVNDCLHRYRFAANWTFYFDVDEYIYLPDGNSLEYVMKGFQEYTQFTIEQNAMSSMLCLNDSSQDYSRQWGFEKLLLRDLRTKIRRDRKYAIQAKNAYAAGVHMSENIVGKTLHKTETKIRYYHYHNSIQVQVEPCRVFLPPSAKNKVTLFDKLPYGYDDNMMKLADIVKRFERQTLGTSELPS